MYVIKIILQWQTSPGIW